MIAVTVMIRRFLPGFVTAVLIFGIVVGLIYVFASIFAGSMAATIARSQPGIAYAIYDSAAYIEGRFRNLVANQDTMLAYAEPGIWGGIGGALVLSVVYSVVRGLRARKRRGGPSAR